MGKLRTISVENDFTIDDVKRILHQLSDLQLTSLDELKNFDDKLFNKMVDLCVSMFLYRKISNKTYASLGDPRLKRIKLSEDDLVDENTRVQLVSFFSNHLHFFHQLVAECFVSAKLSKHCDNQIFYVEYYTQFSNVELKIFLVKKGNQYYVLNKDRYDEDLVTYLSWFSESITPMSLNPDENIFDEISDRAEIEKRLSQLFRRINSNNKNNNHLIEGAITFLDFLGWKGLWLHDEAEPLNKVSRLIEENRKYLSELTKEVFQDINLQDISSLISISDTIAIFTPKIFNITHQELLSIHTKIAKNFIESSCKEGYAIRGAISFGLYCIKDNIMIGPGIDECASWHEQCDWIGVHLTPSAQFNISNTQLPEFVIEYGDIPTKNRINLKYCVDWQITREEFGKLVKKAKAILPEISAKYLNTFKFLEYRRKEEYNGK
ncbi:MAG: hypothetical protein IJ639_06130 [Ruminococcus sp.]|nr:hypothetical protein [Ruminococcus sp.]